MEEMAKHPWLMKRGDRYYLRARVPADLAERYEGREIKRALRTSDRREADRLIRIESAKLEREFEEKRRHQAPTDQPIEDVPYFVLDEIAQTWFLSRLKKEEDLRRNDFVRDLRDVEQWAQNAREDIGKIGDALARRDPSYWVKSAKDLLKAHQIAPETDREALFRFALLLGHGDLELAQRGLQSLSGEEVAFNKGNPFTDVHLHWMRKATASGTDAVPTSSTTVGRLIELFKSDPKRDRISVKGKLGYEVIFRMLEELCGFDALVSSIDREKCREILDLFRRLPVNGTKKYPGKSLRELASIVGARRISEGTLKGHMSNLSALFAFAVREHMIDRNPAAALYSVPKGARNKRLPFSSEQLRKIFQHPPFDAPFAGRSGNPSQEQNPHRYWAPIVCLWSGMRSNECLQLGVSDIRQRDDILVFNVGPDEERSDMKFKSEAAVRTIPVHTKLIDLGFVEFVEHQKRKGDVLLFPDAEVDARGYRSDKFGKWFARHLNSAGAKTPQTAFHSFRHNFRDALRNANVSNERVLALGGWTHGGGAEEGYGSGVSVSELAKEVEKIEYPELNLNHLVMQDRQ